jgi:hypothetical protein
MDASCATSKDESQLNKVQGVQDLVTDWNSINSFDAWGFGPRTSSGVTGVQTASIAVSQICLYFATVICHYRYTISFHASLQSNYRSLGLDGGYLTMVEVCATIGGRRSCPAFGVAESMACKVESLRLSRGTYSMLELNRALS